MNKENFIKDLKEIFDSNVNLKLFALRKQGDIKRISISTDASDSLLNLFKDNISATFINDENNYKIKPISMSNAEDANTYYYFEKINIFEKLKSFQEFTNSDEIFNFSEDNLSDIDVFIITISSSSKRITLYKKNYSINLLKRGKTLFFMNSNTNIDELKKDIIKIDQNFQFISYEDKVLIVNINTLEKQLGYSQVITDNAKKVIEIISSLDLIEDILKLEEMVISTRIAKKINLVKDSVVLNIMKTDVEKVKDFILRIDDLKKSLKFNSEDKLQINTKVAVEKFLKLLDDDYLKSELTENIYDSLNKEKI